MPIHHLDRKPISLFEWQQVERTLLMSVIEPNIVFASAQVSHQPEVCSTPAVR